MYRFVLQGFTVWHMHCWGSEHKRDNNCKICVRGSRPNVLVGFVCLQIVHSATSRDVRERTCFRVRHTDHRVEHIPVGTAISEGFLGDKFVSGLNLVNRRQKCLFYLKPLLVMQYLK